MTFSRSFYYLLVFVRMGEYFGVPCRYRQIAEAKLSMRRCFGVLQNASKAAIFAAMVMIKSVSFTKTIIVLLARMCGQPNTPFPQSLFFLLLSNSSLALFLPL